MPLITFWSKCLGDDDEWIDLFLPVWPLPPPYFFQLIRVQQFNDDIPVNLPPSVAYLLHLLSSEG
jgi:hypothetical protein